MSYLDISDDNLIEDLLLRKEFYWTKRWPTNRKHTAVDDIIPRFILDESITSGRYLKLLGHQQFTENFMNPHTDYKRIHLKWSTGSGKTIGGLSIAKNFIDIYRLERETGNIEIGSVFIIGFSERAFKNELLSYPEFGFLSKEERSKLEKLKRIAATGGKADIDKYRDMVTKIKKRFSNRKGNGFYRFFGYKSFVNRIFVTSLSYNINEMSEAQIRAALASGKITYNEALLKEFKNSLVICDEIHNVYNTAEKNNWGIAIQAVLDKEPTVRCVTLSATPFNNSPTEVIDLLNLLLPTEKRVTRNEFFTNDKDLKPGALDKIAKLSRGRFSFLVDVNPKFYPKLITIGEPLKAIPYLKFIRSPMSAFHYKTYKKIYTGSLSQDSQYIVDFVLDNPEDDSDKAIGIYQTNQIKRLLPNASQKWKDKHGLDYDDDKIVGDALSADRLPRYSAKYSTMLKKILEAIKKDHGKIFIYHNVVHMSGVLFIEQILLKNGFLDEFSGSSDNTICMRCGRKRKEHHKDEITGGFDGSDLDSDSDSDSDLDYDDYDVELSDVDDDENPYVEDSPIINTTAISINDSDVFTIYETSDNYKIDLVHNYLLSAKPEYLEIFKEKLTNYTDKPIIIRIPNELGKPFGDWLLKNKYQLLSHTSSHSELIKPTAKVDHFELSVEGGHISVVSETNINKPINKLTYKLDSSHTINQDKLNKLDDEVKTLITTDTAIPLQHYTNETIKELSRTLDMSNTTEYHRRNTTFKRALHWGQLKLILSEIEFLTKVLEDKPTKPIHFVYAGAAPGNHIKYLQKMFPTVYFELYDPNKFAISGNKNLKIYNTFFTSDIAKSIATRKDIYLAFCSDIRTEPATEENVKQNSDMQLEWWKIMSPDMTMFKFRLPWDDGKTEYPEGDIYVQAYPGPTSTETRLIVKKNAKLIKYDNKQYEHACFYHNSINRNCKYITELGELNLESDGLDNCYDCSSFITIVSNYIKTTGSKKNILDLIKSIEHEIMQGKYTIKDKTLDYFNETFSLFHKKVVNKCSNELCNKCKYVDLNNVLINKKSKAKHAVSPTIGGYTKHKFIPARFVMAHSDIEKAQMEYSLEKFNSIDNVDGSKFLILVGSKIIKESYDLKAIQNLLIMGRPDNIPTLIQIRGRAIRKNSHRGLPPEKRVVRVSILTTCLPIKQESGPDKGEYALSYEEEKYRDKIASFQTIQKIEKVIHENAIDAVINHDKIKHLESGDPLDILPFEPKYANLFKREFDISELNLATFNIFHADKEVNLIKSIVKRLFVELSSVWEYNDLFAAVKNPPVRYDMEINTHLFTLDHFLIAMEQLIWHNSPTVTEPIINRGIVGGGLYNLDTDSDNVEYDEYDPYDVNGTSMFNSYGDRDPYSSLGVYKSGGAMKSIPESTTIYNTDVIDHLYDVHDKIIALPGGQDSIIVSIIDNNNKKFYILFPINYANETPDIDIELPYRIIKQEEQKIINMNSFIQTKRINFDYDDKKKIFYRKYADIAIENMENVICEYGSSFHMKFLEECIEYVFNVWTNPTVELSELHEFYFKMLYYYDLLSLVLFAHTTKPRIFKEYTKYAIPIRAKDIKLKALTKYENRKEELEDISPPDNSELASSGMINLLKSTYNRTSNAWIPQEFRENYNKTVQDSIDLFVGKKKRAKTITKVSADLLPIGHYISKFPRLYHPERGWDENPTYSQNEVNWKENNLIIGFDERSNTGVHIRFKIRNPIHNIKKYKDSRLIENGTVCKSKSKSHLRMIAKKLDCAVPDKINVEELCMLIRSKLIRLELKERIKQSTLKFFYFHFEQKIFTR
jgi:hypothetical protein